MATHTLKRFREEARRLGSAENNNLRIELLDVLRDKAVVALASELSTVSNLEKRLDQVREEMRATFEELRATTEANIAGVLAMADEAALIWETMWEAALGDPAKDRTGTTEVLQWVLDDTKRLLLAMVRRGQEVARMLERPLPRLDELQTRAGQFSLWAQECLARWEMLDQPAPPLDREQIARAQAAYARGECEDVDDVLARVLDGGPWVKD